MVSPVVLGFYTGTAIWLVIKYRYLINTARGVQAFDWRVAGELANAVVIGAAITVAPNVPVFEDSAWCPQINIPPLSAAALIVAALGPLFDPQQIHPATAVVAALITAAYLGVGSCWGLGSIVATTGVVILLVRIRQRQDSWSARKRWVGKKMNNQTWTKPAKPQWIAHF